MFKDYKIIFIIGLLFLFNPTLIRAENDAGQVYDFNYTGSVQEFIAPYTGEYLLEVWGAQGGNATKGSTSAGGKGGYTKGIVTLQKGEKIYVYVGGQGQESINTNLTTGGYNGGGGNYSAGGGATGGGATDMRLVGGIWNNSTSLNSRIIVAGGGSGGAWGNINGAVGGGLTAASGVNWSGYARGLGGTQTAGGGHSGTMTGGGQKQSVTVGSFGLGGRGSGSSSGGSGGGGGWYGGGGGMISSGGGGSSFVFTPSAIIPSGYLGTVRHYLSDTLVLTGAQTMPNPFIN